MESPKPPMPEVSDSERSPLGEALLEGMAWQQKQIEGLEPPIRKRQGETSKPTIKPRTLDKEPESDDNQDDQDENDEQGEKKGPNRNKTEPPVVM